MALVGDAHVIGAGEVQRLDVVAPGEEHTVVAPAARHLDGDLTVRGAIEGPIVGGDDLLDQFERVEIDFVSGPLVSQ